MARRYDSRTTIFSPDGRIFQTEYASAAITHSGAAAGIVTKEGIVLIGVQQATHPLLEPAHEKLFTINDQLACAVAGLNSDATTLLDLSRRISLQHQITFDELIPIEHLVSLLCDRKQATTQSGGLRPYGVSFLFGGWDEHYGFQLYLTGPSGNYGGWKATAIGANSKTSVACLRQEYREDLTLEEAKVLGLKAVAKSLDTANVTPEKLEMMVITRDATKKPGHQIIQTMLTMPEIEKLIEDNKELLVRKDGDDEDEDELES